MLEPNKDSVACALVDSLVTCSCPNGFSGDGTYCERNSCERTLVGTQWNATVCAERAEGMPCHARCPFPSVLSSWEGVGHAVVCRC